MKNCVLELRNLRSAPVPARAGARPWLAATLLGLISLGPALLPRAARAELPPAVYAEQQRRAPLLLELEALTVQRWPAVQPRELLLQARVLAVRRQSPLPGLPAGLRIGQTVRVRYPLPPQRPSGWVGPSPLRPLQPGERVMAWLTADSAQPGWLLPAAGGRSFGPALEP